MDENTGLENPSPAELALQAIVTISREMTLGKNLVHLMTVVLREAAKTSSAETGAIHTLDGSGEILKLLASYPETATKSPRPTIPLGYGIAGWVAKNATPLRALDEPGPSRGGAKRRRTNKIAVPLINDGAVLGVLSLESSGPEPFTEIHERILTVIAAQAAKVFAASTLIRDLSAERDLLDSILGGTPNGVIAINDAHRVVMANRAARRMVAPGRAQEEMRGNLVERYLPQKEFAEGLAKVLGGSSELQTVEIISGEGGEARSFDVKLFRLRRGETTGATIILQDLTEQRKLDEQVSRMGRVASIGQLAAGVAHEIRNPLTGIAITLDILRDQENLSESGREMVSDISREIDRLETLIRGLLDFARPQPTQRRPMRLAKTLEWHRSFQEQCKKKGVECVVDLSTNPKIEGDPERLKQLFLNLAINALDATESGGTIVIRTTLDASARFNEKARVEVSDTGRGMDQETLGRIFDPFFTTKNEGTGLGLSIAHSIVEQHGGTINVSSTPGKGTTFTVELPCHEA